MGKDRGSAGFNVPPIPDMVNLGFGIADSVQGSRQLAVAVAKVGVAAPVTDDHVTSYIDG